MNQTLSEFLLRHADLELRLLGLAAPTYQGTPSVMVTLECQRTGALHGKQVSPRIIDDPERFTEELEKLEGLLEGNDDPDEPKIWIVPCMACGHANKPACNCPCHEQE